MAFNDRQRQILDICLTIIKKTGKIPTRSALIDAEVSRDRIRSQFGNMKSLIGAIKRECPDFFKKKEPHPLANFTKESLGSIIKENNHSKGVFVITSAAPISSLDWDTDQKIRAEAGEDIIGENLFQEGFDAIQTYLKAREAQLVILPMPAHVKSLCKQPRHYDPKLLPYRDCFATEYTFNSHLKAIEAHINPQQINPLTGLKRLKINRFTDNYEPGQEIKRFKTSIIVAHSKQMMDVIPTGNNTHPRIIHSTGAITKPSYLRNRIGMIANEDHKLGALIVEIVDDIFYLRQIQMHPVNGSFVEHGKRYHADGRITEERAEAFKMGDIHPGHQDDRALEAMYELWDVIKPKRIFFEDFFDASSISHHLERKKLTQAKIARDMEHFADLPTEIAYAKKTLESIWAKAPKDAKLIATASNHPEHVMRYLEESRYVNDCVPNRVIGHEMWLDAYGNKNPLQLRLDPKNRMEWTNENQDIFVEGVQMNAHGHLGVNGSRGSKVGHELAYGNAMVAHSHTPSIYHDTFTVGHMTHERHGYNNGPSTWILCCGAVYKGGQKQLYMIVKGRAFAQLCPKKAKKTLKTHRKKAL